MRQILKWIIIGLGSFILIVGTAAVVLYSLGCTRLNLITDNGLPSTMLYTVTGSQFVPDGGGLINQTERFPTKYWQGLLNGRIQYDDHPLRSLRLLRLNSVTNGRFPVFN